MFEGFFTDCALAAHESSLATIPGPFDIHDAGHATGVRSTDGEAATGTFCGVTAEGAKRAKGGTSGGIRT